MVFSGTTSDMDAKFIERFAAPASDRILVLPSAAEGQGRGPGLCRRRRSRRADALKKKRWNCWCSRPAHGLRYRHCASRRKRAGSEAPAEPAAAPASPSASDPFAAHAPKHTGGTSDPFAGHAPVSEAAEPALGQGQNDVAEIPAAESHAPAVASAAPSPEDAEAHQKAQRFARLLVDEIKLYNQDKVAAGRSQQRLVQPPAGRHRKKQIDLR